MPSSLFWSGHNKAVCCKDEKMLRNPHLDMTPKRPRRRLDLVKARGMGEVEQSIYLRQVPA